MTSDTPDTGAGTPLDDPEHPPTAEEADRAVEMWRRHWPHLDWGAAVAVNLADRLDAARPATDPARLDANFGSLMADAVRRVSNREAFKFVNVDWTALGSALVAEYVRASLSVADGPGPEERRDLDQVTIIAGALKGTYWTEFKDAEDDDWRADAEFVLARFQEYGFQLAALSRPLPENREEPTDE